MGSTFNPQILVEKLAKLNSSQQSIGTLSHWCIFHMNKAKQVVETWDRQFHCSPREQRLAFLYLANDILQNSRRKGAEYVGEFWKVLPEALRDVIESGDEFGKNAALRLIGIWDERKVFGSHGQILKDEFVGRQLDSGKRDGKPAGYKLRHATGNTVDRIVSSYQVLYGGQLDEDSALNKCRDAMSYVKKVDKEIIGELGSGHLDASHATGVLVDLKGQHALLRDSIEQLTTIQSSRTNLVNILREVLQEQELKLDQVHSQLQAAHVLSEQAGNMCRDLQISNSNGQTPLEQVCKESHTPIGSHVFASESKEQAAPVLYARQVSFAGKPDHIVDDPKATAAAVAAKLTASSSSAQMLTYVLSSLASEGVIGSALKESPIEFPSEKRLKTENDHSSYVPSENPHTHHGKAFPHRENLQCSSNLTSSLDIDTYERPPPPSSPPPMPPLPPMQPYPVPQYVPAGPIIADGSYGYGVVQQMPLSLPSYSTVGPQANRVASFTALGNGYQSYTTEVVFYGQQPSSLPMAPVSRQ